MAYGNKYKIEAQNGQSGEDCDAYIKERDYTGAVTTLTTGSVPVEITYTTIGQYGGTEYWNLASSSCMIEFADDGTGLLSELIAGDDEQYQLVIDLGGSDEWIGFISPDSYKYNLYAKAIHTVTATDRIDNLYNIPYTQGGATLYSGRARLTEVISRCLDSTTLGIGFGTHMNWYPHIGTNDLDATDDVLYNLRVDQDNFFDTDGNPFSKGSVLEQILMRFQLQMYQIESRWLISQRKRSITVDGGVDKFKVYHYTSAGVAEGTPTVNYEAKREVSFSSASTTQILGPTVTGTVPIGSASIVYYHGNPFLNLFHDLSFEEGLRTLVGGTPLVQGGGYSIGDSLMEVDGFPSNVNIQTPRRFTLAGDTTIYTTTEIIDIDVGGASVGPNHMSFSPNLVAAPADNAVITFLEDQGGWLRSDTSITTELEGQGLDESDTRALELTVDYDGLGYSYNEYVRQESTGEFAGGAGLRLRTGWYVRIPGISTVTTGFKHAFKIYITGSSTTWYFKWSDTTWTTTDTTNEIDAYVFGYSDDAWTFIDIITDELLDGSDPISGTLTIEFLEGKEIDPGSGTQQVSAYYVDNVVEPVIILSDFSPSNEATQTLLTYTGNVNRSSPTTPTLIMGDGPTAGHISRLTVYDSTGAEQDDTSDWSFLPTVASSGFSLDQFAANQWLREFGRSSKKIGGVIWSSETSSAIKPYHQLTIKNPNNDAVADYGWQNQLVYRPANSTKILSSTFTQVQETIVADQLCTVDIKPNTALLAGIRLNTGLVCDTTVDFTPNLSPTHVYFAEATQIHKVPILSTASGWTSEQVDTITTDRNYLKIAVDEAAGYIFAVEQNLSTATTRYVTRRDLDGGNLTTLLTYSSGSNAANTLDLGRINNHLYVGAENFGAIYNGFTLSRYDYDGTAVDTLVTSSDSLLHAIGVDPPETFMFYRENRVGLGSFDRLRKFTLSNSTNDILVDPAVTPSSNSPIHNMVVDDAGGVFYSGDNKIVEFAYADGTGENNLETAADSDAIGKDRANQKIYYVDDTDQIYRMDYDGTSKESVLNHDEDIKSICLGFN